VRTVLKVAGRKSGTKSESDNYRKLVAGLFVVK
jgi:hypothetical protein